MTRSTRQRWLEWRARRACLLSGLLTGWLWGIAGHAFAESTRARDLHVDFSAGLGVGGRAIERPILEGSQHIGPGHFPVADLAVRAHAWPEDPFSVDVWLRYQTSLVDTAWEHAPQALDSEVRVRNHHVEFGVAPAWHTAGGDWTFSAGLGYAMRVFWPDVHNLQTPRQIITGPFLRPELWVTGLGPISLRLGPELFWGLTLDPALRAALDETQTIALGGQVSILADISEAYRLELMYRESHVVLMPQFADMERFITAVVTRKF